MRARLLTAAAAASACLAACAPADRAAPVRAQAAGERQCFSAGAVRRFRPIDRHTVDVEVSRSRVYRLGLSAGCFDVDWAQSVALRPRTGSFVCRGLDAELVVPGRLGPDRCLVTSVRQLTRAEAEGSRRRR
jgi:hypothetical protein